MYEKKTLELLSYTKINVWDETENQFWNMKGNSNYLNLNLFKITFLFYIRHY
jgi:hypothetical protein